MSNQMQNRYVDLDLPEHEQLATCPLNKAHQVVKHRMAKHIQKCRRSHSTKGFKECRFNSSHLVPEAEITDHEKSCEDRLVVERFMYETIPSKNTKEMREESGIFSLDNSVSSSYACDDEDWDTSIPHPPYNPKLKCKMSNIVMHVQHGTPSQREEMRQKERERLKMIQEREAAGEVSESHH